MAVVKNITPDARSLFSPDAAPLRAGDEATVADARFVDRAWPKSTWELVEPPTLDGCVDASTDEAYLYLLPEPVDAEPVTKPSTTTKGK